MIVLSENNFLRAANIAKLCRWLTADIRRPALAVRQELAISVGVGGGVSFYERNGKVLHALFDVDPENYVSWTRNDINSTVLPWHIDEFFRLALGAHRRNPTCQFTHWCTLACYREHND